MSAGEQGPSLRGVLAYVALGSNLGDRQRRLEEAVRRIDELQGLRVLRASRIFETAPIGPEQPDYLNAVIEVDVCRAPRAHLLALHRIEEAMGRRRSEEIHWGPRVIDLDLLWQGGLELHLDGFELPHPRIRERSFVLTPLCDLAPDLRLSGKTLREWLSGRPPEERVGVRPFGVLRLPRM